MKNLKWSPMPTNHNPRPLLPVAKSNRQYKKTNNRKYANSNDEKKNALASFKNITMELF